MHDFLSITLFILAVYGLSNAIAVLKIGQFMFGQSHCRKKDCTAPRHPLETRKGLGRIPYLGDLFYCPPCLAFWIGMAASWWIFSPARLLVDIHWKAAVVDGLAASGAVWIIHLLAEWLGRGDPDL